MAHVLGDLHFLGGVLIPECLSQVVKLRWLGHICLMFVLHVPGEGVYVERGGGREIWEYLHGERMAGSVTVIYSYCYTHAQKIQLEVI